ncbi:HET-domain-containing protein, partial [Microthyrium microscopicum]
MPLKLPFQAKSQTKQTATKVCSNCRKLKASPRSGSTGIYDGRFRCTPVELSLAALRGCEICAFVQAALQQVLDTESLKKVDDVALVAVTLPNLSVGAVLQRFKSQDQSDKSIFMARKSAMKINIGIRDDAKYDNVINGRTYDIILKDGSKQLPWFQLRSAKSTALFGNTGSDSAADWVQSRLKKCLKTHSACRAIDASRSSQKSLLPKRIIDITNHGSIRLKETSGERDDYACLSHCWGKSKAFITETRSLHQYMDGIVWNDLPKTFQEAITFLRYLKIRYIWIDSLCILQDSEEDWLEHSGSMADIYSSAFITIAATRASDGTVGLFSETGEVEINNGKAKLLICEQPKHAHPGEVTSDRFPLLTRGWVAQEMLLSPRVIHFCNGELVYECMHEIMCSCCTLEDSSLGRDYGSKSQIWSSAVSNSTSSKHKLWSSTSTAQPVVTTVSEFGTKYQSEARHFSHWRQMISKYSDLNLTYEKDRFPAMSGLARRFSSNYGTTYAAGLWIENLHNDLLWVMPHRSKPEKRKVDAQAPTWSWVSCGSGTSSYMCDPGSSLYFSVLSVDCVPLSDHDPFGQLKTATLTLQGPLISLVLTPTRKGYDAEFEERGGITVEPDLNLNSVLKAANQNGLFFGLAIVRQESEVRGLVLYRQGNGNYERVGLWYSYSKDGYYQQNNPPEYWAAESLDEALQLRDREIVVL